MEEGVALYGGESWEWVIGMMVIDSSGPDQSKSSLLVPGSPSKHDTLEPKRLQTSWLHDDRSMEIDPHALKSKISPSSYRNL